METTKSAISHYGALHDHDKYTTLDWYVTLMVGHLSEFGHGFLYL